jgi:hypothetical protein
MGVSPNNPPSREASADGEPLVVSPNKNRIVQVRRAGARKLFDRGRKEVFLEWFAATCNLRLSAGKAGVCDKTVFKHLLKDPAFEEAALRALRLGYFRLEARQMQEAQGFGRHPHPAQAELESPSPIEGEGYEVRILDDDVVEEHFDPALAMQLLREHKRGAASGERKPQRTTARSASTKEVAEALAKRLKGFALRVEREEPPHPTHVENGSSPNGPGFQHPPHQGEGER